MKTSYFCEYCGGGIDNAEEESGMCRNCGAPFRDKEVAMLDDASNEDLVCFYCKNPVGEGPGPCPHCGKHLTGEIVGTDDEGDDYKIVKCKEPKFCQKCGQQLNLTQKVIQEWYDLSTGKKVKRYSFHWTCPHPHSFFWNDPHTNVERYGYNLEDALTQKEYSSNYSWS